MGFFFQRAPVCDVNRWVERERERRFLEICEGEGGG